MPLRLCIFGRVMPAHRAGHGMFHPHLVATGLARRGHDITILTTGRIDGVTRERPMEGLRLHYLRGAEPGAYSDGFWRESAAEFDRLHAEAPFDAVMSDSAGAAGWSRLSARGARIPLVAVCHAGLSMMVDPAAREFLATTHHAMLRRARAIIADSLAAAESVAAGLPEGRDRITVIPNAADPALMAVAPAAIASLRADLRLDSRPVVVCLGRVVPEKGGEDLLRAVALLPRPWPQVVIVGPGPFGATLRRTAAALDVPFTLIPGAAHADVGRYLALADLVVMPTRHQEGLPFTLAEAMICRRPVVACDIGGVSEIVHHEKTGLLTPPGDVPALAAAIARMLGDAALRERLAIAGHALALERYSLDAMIDATEGVLLEACGVGV